MRGLGPHMNIEKRRFLHSLIFPLFFTVLLITIKVFEELEHWSLSQFGVRPLHTENLIGIFTYPLIHSDWGHLYSNAVSLFVLSLGLFYFYNKIAYKVFFIIYFFSGVGLWLAARDSYHIGASGIVYGLASFLALSGIIRNYYRLVALSFIVILFYGSLVWGALPVPINVPYSWEGHLWGGFIGLLLAVLYRKQGPQRPVDTLDDEDDNVDDGEDPYWMNTGLEP